MVLFARLTLLVTLGASTSYAQQRPLVSDDPSAPPAAQRLPSYDAMAASEVQVALTPDQKDALDAVTLPGTQTRFEPRLGIPRFLWASPKGPDEGPAEAMVTGQAQRPTQAGAGKRKEELAARGHLNRLASHYRAGGDEIANARLVSIHNTGGGPVVVKLRRVVGGLDVFREDTSVVMTPSLDLVAVSGFLAGDSLGAVQGARRTTAADALAAALNDAAGLGVTSSAFGMTDSAGGYDRYALVQPVSGASLIAPARTKALLYRLPDHLEPAWYAEIQARLSGGPVAYAYVWSAVDGRLLFRHSLVADGAPGPAPFSYQVWADGTSPNIPLDSPLGNGADPSPTGAPGAAPPPNQPRSLITLTSGPISTRDPWLPPGATLTSGNNVDAYADRSAPSGFCVLPICGYTGGPADLFASTTGPSTFAHPFDPTLAPAANDHQIQAAIVQLFYDVNFLHDWYYDVGFDEQSGNAQASNYGRGGIEGDSIEAEAQDFAFINNANMATPPDGARPRMQMFLFSGPGDVGLTVTAPVSAAYPVGTAQFGPQVFDLAGELAWASGKPGVAETACSLPLPGPVAGKIAVVSRGACAFTTKVATAQAAGAAGVVVVNNQPGLVAMAGTAPSVVIPSLILRAVDGASLASLAQPVRVRLQRAPDIQRDGTLDNQVVAHEWMHHVSNRLVGDAVGLTSNLAQGLGEGWSDFNALLMTVRAEDAAIAANVNFAGTYSIGAYASASLFGGRNGPFAPGDTYYFGIRRYPYSTDMSKNPLTYRYVANGVPLPAGIPASPLFFTDGTDNAEVHNTGEVWATMLWECYAALLRETLQPPRRLKFEEARDRMREYLVTALKITPAAPSLLEARDALLAVAFARDRRDFALFWQAFAKRGAGVGATDAPPFSRSNGPVVESYTAGGALALDSVGLTQDQRKCDRDSTLDSGETWKLEIGLRNDGATNLHGTTATITSTNPAVVFPSGNTIHFPESKPGDVTSAWVQVGLAPGVSGIQRVRFVISFGDPDVVGTSFATYTIWANADSLPAAVTFDDVESDVTPWTTQTWFQPQAPAFDGLIGNPWRRVKTTTSPGLNYAWYGPGDFVSSDRSLISPVLRVGNDPLRVTFRERHNFIYCGTGCGVDGAVIELSQDGGQTWSDVGAPLYNGTLDVGWLNPLEGRPAIIAFRNTFTPLTLDLGTAYAGKDVQLRFRVGTNGIIFQYAFYYGFASSFGMQVDDISVSGIVNTPFTAFVPDTGCH